MSQTNQPDHNGYHKSNRDFLYWPSIIMIIGMRFIDVKFLHGDTANGNPATIKDLYQYTGIFLITVSLILWLGIHFIASMTD